MSFTNKDDVIDSRDIIERIEELESILESEHEAQEVTSSFEYWLQDEWNIRENKEEYKEYMILKSLAEECEQYADAWEYGEALIHEDYFEQSMDEMVSDCYELPKDLPFWMKIIYDYDALRMDYTEVNFNGETYLIRG